MKNMIKTQINGKIKHSSLKLLEVRTFYIIKMIFKNLLERMQMSTKQKFDKFTQHVYRTY